MHSGYRRLTETLRLNSVAPVYTIKCCIAGMRTSGKQISSSTGSTLLMPHLVYENPAKMTLASQRRGETRKMDIAFVGITGTVVALVYIERGNDIRVISLRRASRGERRRYAAAKEQN